MSIQERKAYGEALALIQRHGMVAVTEEQMARLMDVIKLAEQMMHTCVERGKEDPNGHDVCDGAQVTWEHVSVDPDTWVDFKNAAAIVLAALEQP